MNYFLVLTAFVGFSITALIAAPVPTASNLALWYETPAAKWEPDALPIGNGHMGAMIFGGMALEQIQFNEESLWIGHEGDTGAYQAFGDLYVEFSGIDDSAKTAYRRELDISRAVHTVFLKPMA